MMVETGDGAVNSCKTDSEKGKSFGRPVWLACPDDYNYGITQLGSSSLHQYTILNIMQCLQGKAQTRTSG